MTDGYNRETTDAMHQLIEEKLDTHKEWLKKIHGEVRYTNGKLNRTIMALILAFGLIVGLGIKELNAVLSVIL